jgi:hypothetical protein
MTRHATWHRRLLLAGLLAGLLLAPQAWGAEVTLALVTGPAGGTTSLEPKQALCPSPFGGWVLTAWPFAVRVDEQPVFAYRASAEREDERLQDKDDVKLDAGEAAPIIPGHRAAEVTLELAPGRHLLQPFNIAFTVGADGALAATDPRVRVDARAGRLEVRCHPVIFRTLRAGRSIAAPLAVACGGRELLDGHAVLLTDYLRLHGDEKAAVNAGVFLHLTLYLPASTPEMPYTVNGIPFSLGAEGQITLAGAAGARVQCPDGRELQLLAPVNPPAATQSLGVRWSGATGDFTLSCDAASVAGSGAQGAAVLEIPLQGERTVRLGTQTVRLPAADPRWPHAQLLWDVRGAAGWTIESTLLSLPGTAWTCRLVPLTANPPTLPATLPVRLEPLGSGPPGGAGTLTARGEGVYTGAFPTTPGLWRLIAAAAPLDGHPLGLVWVGTTAPQAAVSLYTYRNRGLVRRGDALALMWSAQRPADTPAAEWPVVLRGLGLTTPVGRLALPPGKDPAGGSLTLETAALAPGWYEVTVESPTLVCYPLRFRVCQREPKSDYELYSYVYGNAQPMGGSPVTAYYGGIPDGPGLAPFLAETDASLDPAFAAYLTAPLGPAPEKFSRPTPEERTLLALAGLGMRAVPQYPTMLYHEDWNPKHTLPEELTEMQRRLALFVQPKADLPGLGGIALSWYATNGYWEDVPCQDGRQATRNAAADQWVAAQVTEAVKRATAAGADEAERARVTAAATYRARNLIYPTAWAAYFADVRQMAPDLTGHNAIPNWWLGGLYGAASLAYTTLTQRDAVDYSDYGLTAWGNFRTPAWLNMGNRQGQKLHACFMANGQHNKIVTAFGATGRGLDGLSLPVDYPQGTDAALLRIFERFGSYFTALEPLPDVAVYATDRNKVNVVLHDLARMRRPGMLVGDDEILAGDLANYRVLVLAGAPEPSPAVLRALQAYAARGGIVLKDRTCHAALPGRDLGFGYEGAQVHPVWGLAYANGEDEFAHLFKNFKETREPFLTKAFAEIPGIPVTTPDADVVISPLAGTESICCFVMNQTLVPMSLPGKWRQHFVLPKIGELQVQEGWFVRDLLAGTAAPVTVTPRGRTIAVDFTRAEGGIYLLTKREPVAMAMRTARTAPATLRLTAWLADGQAHPLADPMPFEVTLIGPNHAVLFHKFAALSPARGLDVPVPALPPGAHLELTVRDLVLGCSATQPVVPALEALLAARGAADLIGGAEQIAAFLTKRSGPVTVVLDEGQDAFRPAADALVALLRAQGREAVRATWDPVDVQPLPLRWQPTADDARLLVRVRERKSVAWRVGLGPIGNIDKKTGRTTSIRFDDPRCGYDEYGPRLRYDGDVVLFGTPATHRALADLQPYLRRVPTETSPAPGGCFLHYLWSPFQGGYDGLYLGCKDADGAAAAVRRLAALMATPAAQPAAVAPPAGEPQVTWGRTPEPLEHLVTGRFGTPILDLAFTPSGKRLFVMTSSLGDSLFALSPTGDVLERRALQHRRGTSFARPTGGLQAVDDHTVRMTVAGTEYRYSLDAGWVSTIVGPLTGFTGRFSYPVAAATRLLDPPQARVFLGGARRMQAVSGGAVRWTYDEISLRTGFDDLLYPRALFPRAVSGDGRVLLVAGFGIKQDCYGRGTPVNASILGLEAATGKVLWQHPTLLNEGKVIALTDRFLVVDDSGATRILRADTGAEAGRLRPISGADWILPVPGRDALLVVENTAFDRQGLTSRVYLRSLGEEPDRLLAVEGRVTDVVIAPDGTSITVATQRGVTQQFAGDGRLRWRAATPTGGIVRLAPDGQTVLVGARDGAVYWLSSRDGARLRKVDLTPFNTTDADRFVQQMAPLGEVPPETAFSAPPEPPAPSYLATLDPKAVRFGANLLPPERLRPMLRAVPQTTLARLAPETIFTLPVEKGRTYLVELLAAAADPAALTAQTRLEVAVTGQTKSANLPYVGRLPLGRTPARCRAAFRADAAGTVTLTLRAVVPQAVGEGKAARLTYASAARSPAGLLVGDVVVAALEFPGRNVLFDPGPPAMAKPLGVLTCEVKPWTGGSSLVRHAPYPCPQAAGRCVDGVLANQESAWTREATGEGVDHANGRVRFRQAVTLSAIAIYEDPAGPVPAGTGVRETVAPHYALYVREAATRQWRCVGVVTDNTQLVNLFPCPPVPIDELHYFWAGRTAADRIDGPVRLAELEAYAEDGELAEDDAAEE